MLLLLYWVSKWCTFNSELETNVVAGGRDGCGLAGGRTMAADGGTWGARKEVGLIEIYK